MATKRRSGLLLVALVHVDLLLTTTTTTIMIRAESTTSTGGTAGSTGGIHEYTKCPLKPPAAIRTAPLVIAHRGASFHLPEHTLAGYRLALELGADYIEPDLVGTKDGHLVVMHSVNLNITTNVATVFPDRYSTLEHNNNETGYYSFDFTLDEIRQLKVKQRLPTARNTQYDYMFAIPTFQETLELLYEWNHNVLPLLTEEPSLERAGVYAELKEPSLYEQVTGKSMVDIFLQEVENAATSPSATNNTSEAAASYASFVVHDDVCESLKYNQYVVPPLVVQSFDATALQQLSTKWTYNTSLPLVLLVHATECFDQDFWFHVVDARDYVHGIGVDKQCLSTNTYREFMTKAKEDNDIAIHAWVERKELTELITSPGNDNNNDEDVNFDNLQQELKYLYCDVGVHGVFSENVADAVLVGQVGCDKNTTEEQELPPPTMAPTITTNETSSSSNPSSATGGGPNSLCYESVDEQAMYMGLAGGILGLFLGTVVTLCITNSRCCRKRRRHQLVVPQHDDGEII